MEDLPAPATLLAAEMPPVAVLRAVELACLHHFDVSRTPFRPMSPGRWRNPACRCLVLNLLVRDADTLGGDSQRATARAVTRDVAVGHDALHVMTRLGVTTSLTALECASREYLLAGVQILENLKAGGVERAAETEVGQGSLLPDSPFPPTDAGLEAPNEKLSSSI